MPARTKEARLRRQLTVQAADGRRVTFHLKRGYGVSNPPGGYGPLINVPTTDVYFSIDGGPSVRALSLFQSQRAAAFFAERPNPPNIPPMAIVKSMQSGERRQSDSVDFNTLRFDTPVANAIVDFIDTFHLKHISGEVQRSRVEKAVSKLGTPRELGTVGFWQMNLAFPLADWRHPDAQLTVYDFPESGRDELHFVEGGVRPGEKAAVRYQTSRQQLFERARNLQQSFSLDDEVRPGETVQFILLKRDREGEDFVPEGQNDIVAPGVYVARHEVMPLLDAHHLVQAREHLRFPMYVGAAGAQALVEYLGRSKTDGAKLRLSLSRDPGHYVGETTQRALMSGDYRVTTRPTTWNAVYTFTLNPDDVQRILVALDARMEQGLSGVEDILRPWRSTTPYPASFDPTSPFYQDKWEVEFEPVGRIAVRLVSPDGQDVDTWTDLSASEIHQLLKGIRVKLPVGEAVPSTSSVREVTTNSLENLFLVADLERALVALDALHEQGAALDGLAGVPPNRVEVHDVDGRKWQARFFREGPYILIGYRPMIGKNYDDWQEYTFHMREANVFPIPDEPGHFTVRGWDPDNSSGSGYTYPALAEGEAQRLQKSAQAFIDYYETGKAREERVEARERKLGRSVLIGTLKTWRNPVEGAYRDAADETLDVFAFPDSGTDTLRLSSVGSLRREAFYTHASILAARYASPSYTHHAEQVPPDLILVYPVGMETYYSGDRRVSRIGLYATRADVYNLLWTAYSEQQRGWGRGGEGAESLPNFPFEVRLLWGTESVAGRIEYMGKDKAGIPQFEVRADLTRTAPSSLWAKRTRNLATPHVFYTDAKLLQRTDRLFMTKELRKWQHTHNPSGNPENLPPWPRLDEESRQRVLVALDARYERGLKGLDGDAPRIFPLHERDDSGYAMHVMDVFAKVGMAKDGHPYVWLYAVREVGGWGTAAREYEKPVAVLVLSIFHFTNNYMLYSAFKAHRLDGDKEQSSWWLKREDVDAIRAEICEKVRAGRLELGDYTRGESSWCAPVQRLAGFAGAGGRRFECAFRNYATGDIVVTYNIHDASQVINAHGGDFEDVEREWEAGYVDASGKFYSRKQAAKVAMPDSKTRREARKLRIDTDELESQDYEAGVEAGVLEGLGRANTWVDVEEEMCRGE